MFDQVEPIPIATNFRSPEGPSFNREGLLLLVDFDAGMVYRCTRDGRVSPFVDTAGIPTGSKFHRDGRLFVADGKLGILEISPQGEFKIAAAGWKGQPFAGTNDLVFAKNGDLYFTDPKGSDVEHPTGSIFLMRRTGEVERFATGFQFPNGIVLSDDESTLFVAETFTRNIWAFELDGNGRERSRRVFAELEGWLGPDGMAFGRDGNLYAAHFGKGVVAVIDPEGAVIAELPAGGQRPTNVAFWESSLYVTEVEKGQVMRLDIGVQGQTLFGLS